MELRFWVLELEVREGAMNVKKGGVGLDPFIKKVNIKRPPRGRLELA